MPRFFNTTGPCRPDKHYMLPPEDRLVRAQLERYIRDELYWVLHAPRQTGKTTFLQSWMRSINADGEAVACYVSVERCQQFPLAEEAIPAVCEAAVSYASAFLDRTPEGRRKSWDERLTWQTEKYDGKEITVVGG